MLARLPAVLLRLEGAAVFGASIALYLHSDLAGPRAGAATYNAVHTELWPIVIAALGVLADASLLTQVALIWLAHIGIDRVLGYGLKYPTAFEDTHLGRV